MKKIFYCCFGLALVLATGCAITNYELIVDENSGEIINTNGKAVAQWKWLVQTEWPDGYDGLYTMVDQNVKGDRVLTTYSRYSTEYLDEDWLYCSPDWNGCAIVTAQDPELGDLDPYDYTYNPNCSGFRSLFYVMSQSRYGECGRSAMSVGDRITLSNTGRIETRDGVEGLLFDLNRDSFGIRLDNNAGVVQNALVVGDATAFMEYGTRRLTLDMTNSLLGATGRSVADFIRHYGTDVTTVTFTLNGISKSWDVGGMDADRMTANMNKTY